MYNFNLTLTEDFYLLENDKNLENLNYYRPVVTPVVLSIYMENVENLSSTGIIASALLLRELSGVRPYIIRVKTFQSFSEKRLSISVSSLCSGKYIFNALSLISSFILPSVGKRDYSFLIEKWVDFYVLLFCFRNLRFIRTVESHSIFFKWEEFLNIKLSLNLTEHKSLFFFLSLVKLF